MPLSLTLPSPEESLSDLLGAPSAPAAVSAPVIEEPSAWNEIAPPAVMLRSVVEKTLWLASVSASATPTATEPPIASPAAVVSALARSVAFASSVPPTLSAAPVPIVAEVVTFESAIAIAGATETFGLEAPVFASTVIVSTFTASSVTLPPPVIVPPSSIPAKVVSSITESANEAPTPTLEPPTPPPAGSALTIVSEVEAAPSSTAPAPALTDAPVRIAPVVWRSTMLIETEAPMPTWPPLAPEVVSAPKRCVVSPPTLVIEASAVKPWPEITEPPSAVASLCMCATFTATPAPTLTPELPVETAEPSPFAFESVFAEVFRETAPPATIVIPVGIVAFDELVEMLIPTAAATLTEPLDVSDEPVAPAPPESPPAGARESA